MRAARGRSNQTSSGGTATRQAQTQSGASRSTTRQVDAENREIDKTTTATTAWGESGTRSREVEGHGGYATVEGSGKTSTGRSASGEARGGPHLLRPAGGRRNGQHEIQRHLQRRRRPHAVWRVQHRGGRPVRRTCDDHVAIGVQDFDILRSLLLHLRRHVLPAVHIWWRPLLLPRSATLLLVLQLPSSRRDHSHNCGRQVPGVAGRPLLQADDDQRRKDDIPGGARAAGRHDADRCRRRACS